jgi:hypothetical protein
LQEYKFQLYIGGEEGISAKDLAIQLSNLNDLITIASGSNCYCNLKVVSAKTGSFVIDFFAIAQVLQTFDANVGINMIKTTLETVGEWFKIKSHLHQNPPKSIEERADGVHIESENGNVYVTDYRGAIFFENSIVRNSMINIGNSLSNSNSNRNCFSISGEDGKEFVKLDKEQFEDISAPNDHIVEDCFYTSEQRMRLIVIKPVLKGNSRWTFKTSENKTIEARIEDETWKDDFDEGNIKLFAGIGLEVLVALQYKKDKYGKPIEDTTKYSIKKVYSTFGEDNKQETLSE